MSMLTLETLPSLTITYLILIQRFFQSAENDISEKELNQDNQQVSSLDLHFAALNFQNKVF